MMPSIQKTLCVAAAALVAVAQAADNGRAITPPQGYRNWNQYQCAISQTIMESIFTAMVDKSRNVDGQPTSLADLGYSDVGLDDCWQACGNYGPNNYTYHNASGYPMIDPVKFPDMTNMNAYAHSLNLTTGWYGNNCACKDHCTDVNCFANDAATALDLGFDSIKLDGCGAEENVELWYDILHWDLQQRGGKTAGGAPGVLLENCHNGGGSKNIPTSDWCPFNYYRSSTDIRPVYGSILANLLTVPVVALQNLSTPGCWAYPDMLEVGVFNTQSALPPLTYTESRTHFGAWCIVSSPLILGLNVTDSTAVDLVWDIITNREAIAVNQDYSGMSGTIFYSSPDETFFAPCGWWLDNCTFASTMYWYKTLSNGDTAVLLMNNANTTADLTVTWSQVPSLSPGGSYKVRDIWAKADVGTFATSYTASGLASRDSAFLRISTSSREM